MQSCAETPSLLRIANWQLRGDNDLGNNPLRERPVLARGFKFSRAPARVN